MQGLRFHLATQYPANKVSKSTLQMASKRRVVKYNNKRQLYSK